MLTILVENIEDVGSTDKSNDEEEWGNQGRKDAKNDDHLIIELQHICPICLTLVTARQLCNLDDIVNCPDTIGNIVVGIQEEETILHLDIIGIFKLKIDHQAEKDCRPHHTYNEMDGMYAWVKRASLIERRANVEQINTHCEIEENYSLVYKGELRILNQVLVGMATSNSH